SEREKIPEEDKKTQVFLRKIASLTQQLLKAAEVGDWPRVKESLLQGAYVNTVDARGYNALQKAIVAKKVSLELLNGLIAAGIDLHHKTDHQQNAFMLAKVHLPEMAVMLNDEPVLGLRRSLVAPTTLEACEISFQAHCERG